MSKVRAIVACMAAFGLLCASGCATVKGVGKDLEKAGEEIQQASES